jgi:hypothetical protein
MVTFAPEPDMGKVLAQLDAQAGLIDAIVTADRMVSILTAAKLKMIEAAHEIQVGTLSHALAEREFRAEIATALRISERAAETLIDEAVVLARHLPTTQEALADGRITPRQARVIVDELGHVETTSAATSSGAPSTPPTSPPPPSPARSAACARRGSPSRPSPATARPAISAASPASRPATAWPGSSRICPLTRRSPSTADSTTSRGGWPDSRRCTTTAPWANYERMLSPT